jgi:hypothetical protein
MRVYNRMMVCIWSLVAITFIWGFLSGSSSTIPAICSALAVAATFLLYPKRGNYKFQLIGTDEVRSPVGFSVRVSGDSLVYEEGARKITLSPGGSPGGVAVFRIDASKLSRWDLPNEGVQLSDDQKSEIRTRLIRALSYRQVMSGRRK